MIKPGIDNVTISAGRKKKNRILIIRDQVYRMDDAYFKLLSDCLEWGNKETIEKYTEFMITIEKIKSIGKDIKDYDEDIKFFDSYEIEMMKKELMKLKRKKIELRVYLDIFMTKVVEKTEILKEKLSRLEVDQMPLEYMPVRGVRYTAET